MKDIFKQISVIVFVLALFTSCNDYNDSDFSPRNLESGWIEFPQDVGYAFSNFADQNLDGDDLIQIPVLQEVSTNRNGYSYTYSVELVDGNVTIDEGQKTVEVPANTLESSIPFKIDKSIQDDYSVKFTLLSVDSDKISVGVEGEDYEEIDESKEFTLTVKNLIGSYAGEVILDGGLISEFNKDITEEDIENRSISFISLWGTNPPLSDAAYPGNLVYVSGNAALTTQIDAESLNLSLTQPEDEDEEPVRVFPGGSGFIDGETQVIEYTLEQNAFQNTSEPLDVILTPID